MRALARMRDLRVTGGYMLDGDVVPIARALPRLTCLQRLHLEGIKLNGDSANALAAALRALTVLTCLRFAQTDDSLCADRIVLVRALGELSCLVRLRLSGSSIDSDCTAVLARVLPSLAGLTCLDLSMCRMSACSTLAPALGKLIGLRALNLSENDLCNCGCASARSCNPRAHSSNVPRHARRWFHERELSPRLVQGAQCLL